MNIVVHLGNNVLNRSLAELIVGHLKGSHVVSLFQENGGPAAPDLVLVNVATLSEEVRHAYTGAKLVLVDTGLQQQELIRLTITYKVSGIIAPSADLSLFLKALDAVCRGELWIGHETFKALLDRDPVAAEKDAAQQLSKREQEIIDHICQGRTNREIAQLLSLSEQTVKAHLNRIYRKLRVSSRSKLLAMTMQRPSR